MVIHRGLVVGSRAVRRCMVYELGFGWEHGFECEQGFGCERRRLLAGKTRRHGGSVGKRWRLVVVFGSK